MIVKNSDSRRIGFLIAVISAIIFGFWPTATRGLYAEGGNVAFALLTATWARGLCMAIFCFLTGRKLFQTKNDCYQSFIGGFYQAICLGTIYAALTILQGPIVIIILFTHTLILLFYLSYRREIQLDRFTLATTAAALIGLSFVLDIWHKQPTANILGYLLAFIGALATVSRLYVYGHQTQERHPIVVGAENFLVAALLLSVAMFWQMPHAPTSFAGLLYTILLCATVTLATFGMFYGIALIGSFRWSLFVKLEPVFTSLFAAWILGETLRPQQYAGIGIVVGSLLLYQVMDQKRADKSQ